MPPAILTETLHVSQIHHTTRNETDEAPRVCFSISTIQGWFESSGFEYCTLHGCSSFLSPPKAIFHQLLLIYLAQVDKTHTHSYGVHCVQHIGISDCCDCCIGDVRTDTALAVAGPALPALP